jgi:hypothetical protein
MKRSRFTDKQISCALRQVEGDTAAADVCRQVGISEAKFYIWKKALARAIAEWAYRRGVLRLDFIRPEKPVETA